MPEKTANKSVQDNLKLNGDKIKLETRPPNRCNTASAKSYFLRKAISRPVSAIPPLRLYKVDDLDYGKKRPFSAGYASEFSRDLYSAASSDLESIDELSVAEKKLPSSKLLKHLLSEPIKSWRSTESSEILSALTEQASSYKSRPTEFDVVSLTSEENLCTKKQDCVDDDSIKEQAAPVVEVPEAMVDIPTRSMEEKYALLPGLASKPPLPIRTPKKTESSPKGTGNQDNKTDAEKIVMEGVEINEFDLSLSNFSLKEAILRESDVRSLFFEEDDEKSRALVQNWIVEDKQIENDIIESERQTDRYIDDLKNVENVVQRKQDKERECKENNDHMKASQSPKCKSPPKKYSSAKKKFTATAIRAPKDAVEKAIEAAEEDSWITTENKRKSKINESPVKASFKNVLSGLEELEQQTISSSEDLIAQNSGTSMESNDSVDDEIVSILQVLENADKESQKNMESIKNIMNTELSRTEKPIQVPEIIIQEDFDRSIGNPVEPNREESLQGYSDLWTFLDEVDRSSQKSLYVAQGRALDAIKLTNTSIKLDTLPKYEDLIGLSSNELAQYVIDLSLRIKEKSSSITLLQKELSSLREQVMRTTKHTEQVVKEKLKSQKQEYEEVVKRHQKFIDQLIADKKSLNQQCESLITEMKVLEDRYTSNMKAVEHRHQVELQRAKEMYVAGEKIRRERWIDNKTQKIKEMTVKSLEPELESMSIRHQQELADLRSIHKLEIEDLELKAARRTQQQLEALRQQLAEEREKAMAHERELMRQRYEQMVEAEEKSYQEQRRRLLTEHANRIAECEKRENDVVIERDKAIKQAQEELEEKLQAVIRRHGNEIRMLRESTELEMEAWKNNYRKQQAMQLAEKEAAIREQCRKERDREIEEVIERLEAEASENKAQIEQSAENRIRRLKEKFDSEIKDLEKSEHDAKSKYLEVKNKLLENDDTIITLNVTIKQLRLQLIEVKEVAETLQSEKDKMKEMLKDEVKSELQSMEMQLNTLKSERDKELQQVYSRVKVAIARKDETIEELNRDHKALHEKCVYLESMLEQQRKEYLIK